MRIDYDEMAEHFDETRSQNRFLLESVAAGVLAIVGDGEKVLDIGTGTGRYLGPMIESGIDAIGLDISKNMLLKAKSKGFGNLVRGDASRLPFGDRSVKASLVTNVTHLVSGWRKLLDEACRVSTRAVIAVDLKRPDNDPMNVFKAIMREKGFAPPRAGPLESEVAEQASPECRINLGGYDERMKKEEVLANLRLKTFTFQSELTDEQNRQCLQEFGGRYGDEFDVSRSVSLIVWEPSSLSRRIAGLTFGYPHATTF